MERICTVYVLAGFLLSVTVGDNLVWNVISDPNALCNDYTPAGYFVARGRSPGHWIIFLESGGGCYSPDTCNKRYFSDAVRRKFESSESLSVAPLINYNVLGAKNAMISSNTPLATFVSPLVTSILTFQNTSYFKNGISVQGQGILDDNCTNNPIYCNHTRVIIPYCSSDLWLANSPVLSCNISKQLYDQCYGQDYNSCANIGKTFFTSCFLNSPNELPFVFRGQEIYRGALRQLMDDGLANSSTVTLVGSSAGGVGVINHANWTQQLLRNSSTGANLSVIADSSWFINFQGSVKELFVGIASNESTAQNSVYNIITATDTTSVTCSDTSRGSPCCFSAFCMLSTPEYYPSNDISTFMVFGLYDVYQLANSLIGLEATAAGQSKNAGAGLAIKFVQTISEYGGAINDSLQSVNNGRFSYYVTECFQHIYLVTSTLWGDGNLLGTQAVDVTVSFGAFSQSMQSDTWSTMQIGTNKTTIRDALSQWYPNRYSSVVTFRDSCSGPHCSSTCPDMILLGSPPSDIWSTPVKIFLLLIVVAIALLSLCAKAAFQVWLFLLKRKQKEYLKGKPQRDTLEEHIEEKDLEFPECSDEKRVSVSCLDLHCSVTVRTTKVKDERKDETVPRILKMCETQDEVDTATETTELEATSGTFRMSTLCGHQQQPPPETSEYYTTKEILKGISIYFNPGDLCAIMGPSGCGKTTLLDLLTGRHTGKYKGNIFVNGQPIHEVRAWYTANTGYVLQLATPYFEELTVRENLTLASQIKLPDTFTTMEKFIRIEQVLAVSELQQFADTVVGGATGPGLSGGQKRRLAIALQLLKLPSVLFLDEPTSGLDATSSLELLSHLNRLADSKRTVIITIHQPRLEIFYMFKRLVLLTDGKVAYHGVPEKAYEVCINAVQTKQWRNAPHVQLEKENPADVIMDMVGNHKLRALVTDYYERSADPQQVHAAIEKACHSSIPKAHDVPDSLCQKFTYAIYGAKRPHEYHGWVLNRLAALEARGALRSSLLQLLYLPLIFFAYGLLLGTVYYQSYNPLLAMSGFCVYSVASALFMFPALYLYYQKALEVNGYERADGAGRSADIVIQGFIRGITHGFFPVIICAAVLYLLMVNQESYNVRIFIEVLLVNLALNQTWVALLIFVICAFPKIAFCISPIISSVAGFTSGFFVPRESMPISYRWLFYINPNYYGFSASAYLLLNNFQTACVGPVLECFPSSPQYYLKYFNFDDVNPYLHITILIGFTVLYLLLATLSNSIRYSNHASNFRRLINVLRLQTKKSEMKSMCVQDDGGEDHAMEINAMTTEVETKDDSIEALKSPFLNEGEGHFVWKPETRCVMAKPLTLSERRKNLENRVQATREVLISSSKRELGIASATTMAFKEQMHHNEHYHFHDVVSQYMRDENAKKKLSSTPESIDVLVNYIVSSPSATPSCST